MTQNSLEKHVLNLVCSVFDAYSAVLFQPEDTGEACRLTAWFSLGDKIDAEVSILPGKGLVGWIIRNRQPILYPHFDQRQSNLGYYIDGEESSIKAFMGCPVPAGGALCVDSKRQYSFSDKDHKILQLFAEIIAKQKNMSDMNHGREDEVAIPRYFAKMALIQDLRFRGNRWPKFLQDYLHAVTDAVGFEYGVFASVDTPQETYRVECESSPLLIDKEQSLVLPIGSGIVGWVFRNGKPVITEGGQGSPTSMIFGKLQKSLPGFQAVICMPVKINQTVSGALCLAHRSERRIDEGMRSFINQVVDYLSLFLENLYFKNRLRDILPKAKVHNQGAQAYDPDQETNEQDAAQY